MCLMNLLWMRIRYEVGWLNTAGSERESSSYSVRAGLPGPLVSGGGLEHSA